MTSKTDILIIGAGLSGLSAAWHLPKKYKVRIVESSDKCGGLATTEEIDGFRFDQTGHLLHLHNVYIKRWLQKDLFHDELLKIDRISRVWSHNVYTKYPFQSNTFGLPIAVAEECLDGYLKILKNPPKKKIRSFEDYIYHYFGHGFARHFMIPYNKKIWGAHPREMSAVWCDKFVPIPKKEEVLAGSKSAGHSELGYNASFYYPRRGIGELTEKLEENILQRGLKIEFGKKLLRVDCSRKEVILDSGEKIKYDTLISTVPLKEFVWSLFGVPAKIKNYNKLLVSKSLFYLNIALKCPLAQEFHWCYVPSPGVPFYRVGSYSNFSADCAPSGCSSLYVELSGRNFKQTVVPVALKHLQKMKIIKKKSDVLFVKPKFIRYAYVIYDHNYTRAVPALHKFLKKYEIFSIGRYGAWNYSSMEDGLIMGKEICNHIN